MIQKSQLKGKYVRFRDKDGKIRTQRVIRVSGNYLTVISVTKVKARIYKDQVIGREFRKRGLESINWERAKK